MNRTNPIARGAVRLAAALLVGVPLLVPARAHAQRWAVSSWTTEDGLPSNAVLGIRQTGDGYLWLASYQGLVRFDGVAFRMFAEDDIPGVVRASFFAVAADTARGRLWAASESNGVARLAGGRWRVFTTRDGLSSDRVTALHIDARGAAWVGTRAGICRIVGDRIEHLPALPGADAAIVTALTTDAEGHLWIGTVASGVFRWDGHAYVNRSARDGLGDDRVASLYSTRDGAVWVGSYGAGVARIRPRGGDAAGGAPADDSVARFATAGDAVPRRVNEILEDAQGALWIGADNGLFRLKDGRVDAVARPGGLPLTQVDALTVDAEGSLWVGSRNAGLVRVRSASVRMITAADGLPHDLVFAVDGDGAGGVWIATLSGVAHRSADGATTHYTTRTGALRDDVARDVLRDRRGDVWVATNGGLTRIRDGTTTTLTSRDGLADDRARALLEDRAGGLWVGTFNGLTELHGGAVRRRYGHAEGLADGYVLSVFQDAAGTIWVGTQSSGLFRLERGRFVPGPAALAQLPVFRMADGPNGALWAGTSRGLALVRGGHVTFVSSREGLPGNAVFQALDDGLGALWLTGPWGIDRAPRGEVERVALGARRAVDAKHFGSDDGLRALQASPISRAWRAPDGALWFPTSGGVALVDPQRLQRNLRPPPTHVEAVALDGAAPLAALAGGTVAPPGTRKLEFLFTAPSFVSPEQVRFRYRLDGFDRGWVDAGTQRRAVYTNLAPGAYTFRVQARNEDGVWSAAEASARVTIRPHLWQTRWFLALVAGVLVALALVAHRLRIRVVTHATRENMLRALSLRDDLTGLYNRRGLVALAEQQVRTAERARVGFAVAFVDMDGLKEINDTWGHRTGDRAIADAAALLRATFRESDVVARLGGDEFAALVPDDPSGAKGGAEAACARLADLVARHNATAGRPYRVSLSVGLARFDPGAPLSLETLLEAADRAMYADKKLKMRMTGTPARGMGKI
ncbi:MAG: two-component regulator propeller domain-containing protein [Gemmatimonadaceae bacterium]